VNSRQHQQPVELETMPYVTPTILRTMMRQSTVPVLVSFHASWAKASASALGEVAAEAAGRVHAIQVDVSAYPHIAERFNVRIIPTLLIFKHGVPVEFIVGLVPRRFIRQTIRRAIGAVSRCSAVEGTGQC
jgi:thioredoxin-like negative regulator of GroEL